MDYQDNIHEKIIEKTYLLKICTATVLIRSTTKSNNVKEMNDLRPIALTSTLVKILERIVMNHFIPTCQPYLDPLQFAYRSKRGV